MLDKEKLLTIVELIYLLRFQLLLQSLPQFINCINIEYFLCGRHLVLVITTTQSAGYYGIAKVQKDLPFPQRSCSMLVAENVVGVCVCWELGEEKATHTITVKIHSSKCLLKYALVMLMRERIHLIYSLTCTIKPMYLKLSIQVECTIISVVETKKA